MNSILSIFEAAVADYLLLASITAALLVAVALGFVRLGRVKGPANRHMIWLFTLLAIVLLPGIWLYGPKLTLYVLPTPASQTAPVSQSVDMEFTAGPMVENTIGTLAASSAENAAAEGDALPSFRLPPIMTFFAWGWGVGFLLMLIRLVVGGIRLRQLLQTAVPVADAMGLDNGGKRRIDLLLSSKVDCPVCFGLLRPIILMPTKMYDETNPEDLRMILCHEVAHIERKDCWVNLFQRLVEAALFFHPLVWYASFQLTQQREELCDRHVIADGVSPENYAELLSRIARQGFEKRTLQAVALFEGRLLSRVKSLMGLGGRLQIRASRRAIGILAAAAVLFLAVGTVRLDAQPEAANESDTSGEFQAEDSFRPQEETLGANNNRPVGDCSISGRVVSAVTGEPVEDATVYLFYVGTHAPIFIKVASDGTFSFEDIPGGEYALHVINTDGFQDTTYDLENDTQNNGMGTVFSSLLEGEKKSDVLFQLEPLPEYSISGRILGEDRAPVKESGLVIKALKRGEATDCNPVLYNAIGSVQVEADGSYHLDALSGEPVLVMVEEPSFFVEGDHSFPPCYYPGTISRGKAAWVDFDETISQKNIDIQLVSTGGVLLEGRVVDEETGAPVPDTIVAVDHPDMLNVYVSTLTDETGYYRFENIGAEELLVHFDARTSGYVRQRMPVEMAAGETVRLDAGLKRAAEISGIFLDEKGAPFVVSENAYGYTNTIDPDDPTKNQVTLSIGVSVSSTETEDGRIEKRKETLFVNGEGDYPSGDWRSPTRESFLVEAVLPGETTLKFFPKEQGVEVKRIVYNGEDILELEEMPMESEPVATAILETRPGETIEGIAIVLGSVVGSSSP